MTDPTNDTEPTPHDLNSPPSSDYVAEAQVREAKAAARAERQRRLKQRERKQKERMDAAHEKAKADQERCIYVGGRDDTRCLLTEGHTGTHHFGTRAWHAAREGSEE